MSDGPSVTRTLVDTAPKVFYVEDPWGQYSLRSGADAWTEQLPRLLREAHAGHQYVVTSRADMLGQAKTDEKLKRWTVVLDAEQYRAGELAAIYDKRLEVLATDLQGKALDFRIDALEALETPFEVDLFFAHIADGPEEGEVDGAFFRRILGMAHRDAVEDVVVSYLRHSDQNGASAVIWALLAARSQFDRNQLITLNRGLRIIAPTVVDGLEKLVDRLVATRHLRQPGQAVSFSHPSVRAGFEMFISENWVQSEAALKSLVSALTQLEGIQRDWGLETAARALKAIDDLISAAANTGMEFDADGASRTAIDLWLEEGLVDPRSDFRPLLQLASDVGTEQSTPSELARWFIKGIAPGSDVFLEDWQPPTFDDSWYARVSADPRSFAIAERFVLEQLPKEHNSYGPSFANELDRIASGLTPAFVAAARRLVAWGIDGNVRAVAAGAVRDLHGYEEVLDGALDELVDVERWHEREAKEWRAIEDGERDEGHEEAFQSRHEYGGYPARVFVDTYVNRVRAFGDWRSLTKHTRKRKLGRAWAESVSRTSGHVSPEELRALIAVTQSSKGEGRAWEAVRQHWSASLASELEQRILSEPEGDDLRAALMYCSVMASPRALASCLQRTAAVPVSFVQILVDMHEAYRRISSKERAGRLRTVLESIPPAGKEIFEALAIDDKPARAVGRTALSLLDEAAAAARPFALDKIVPVMMASGAAPSEAIRRWLVETDERELAKAAAEAAIGIGDDALVWIAVDHARSDARVAALTYLARSLPNPLPRRILSLWSDPSSRVRRRLVSILAGRPDPDHQTVLLRLTEDEWSDADSFRNDPPSYPIAREAIAALAGYGSLSDEIGEVLLSRAERTDDRSLGIVALDIAAQWCGPETRRKIWALSSKDQPRWVCVDAIEALARGTVVETNILDDLSAKFLLRAAPSIAASAVFLLATHAQVETVVEVMERLAYSTKRRALVLPGAWGLIARDRTAAEGLLELLESGHPARRLLDLEDGEQLPEGALDDLGDVRIRRAVEHWLSDRMVKAGDAVSGV